jgi:hypothetical protein
MRLTLLTTKLGGIWHSPQRQAPLSSRPSDKARYVNLAGLIVHTIR